MHVSHLRAELEESRRDLFAAVRGLEEEQFRFTPQATAWSIATHLAHLLRIERVYAERAEAALREDEPRVASTRVHNDDDPKLALRLAVPQIVHGMQATRRQLDAVLERCDDASLERTVMHETLGRMTIAEIAAKMSGHEREHAAAVAEIARQVPPVRNVTIPLAQRS
jgi:uncharacterized damage-inducible protein DinB